MSAGKWPAGRLASGAVTLRVFLVITVLGMAAGMLGGRSHSTHQSLHLINSLQHRVPYTHLQNLRYRKAVKQRETRAAATFAKWVPAPGVEPGTFGLQNVFEPTSWIVNQTLAALANLEISVIQARLRHSQSTHVTSQANGPLKCRLIQIRFDIT